MNQKTTAPAEPEKKPSNRFRFDAMPPAYQAAGRIIQILTSLNLSDAEQALSVVNQMFKVRAEAKAPNLPE